jgi:transcriptional regulator with XRE-family HTH domain
MVPGVNGRTIVREARRRAGLTQAELADRAGTTQSSIARLETGATDASLARIDLLVRACGFDLLVELDRGRIDPDEWQRARRNLALTPDQRVRNIVAAATFVLAGRKARST